jgi:hypothetical protein
MHARVAALTPIYPFSDRFKAEFSDVQPPNLPAVLRRRCAFGDGAEPEGYEYLPQKDRPDEDPLT